MSPLPLRRASLFLSSGLLLYIFLHFVVSCSLLLFPLSFLSSAPGSPSLFPSKNSHSSISSLFLSVCSSLSPYPLNFRVEESPPIFLEGCKFRGWPSRNSIKQGVSDTPPPEFRFSTLESRDMGL